VAASRAKRGVAHERLSQQVDQILAIDGIHSADDKPRWEAEKEPYLISIGDRAEQIAQAFEDRQRMTQDTLDALRRLTGRVHTASG
jgi:hypothetical protein